MRSVIVLLGVLIGGCVLAASYGCTLIRIDGTISLADLIEQIKAALALGGV